jgi:predicted nucleotide-binding protein
MKANTKHAELSCLKLKNVVILASWLNSRRIAKQNKRREAFVNAGHDRITNATQAYAADALFISQEASEVKDMP